MVYMNSYKDQNWLIPQSIFREFLLKGLDKVKIEMDLVSIAHNLQKIWKQSGAAGC